MLNTKDELRDKIDKLTVMMSKLAAKDNHERKPFKPQIYKSRGQNRSYGQGGYQNRSDSRSRDMLQIIVQDRIIEATDLEETPECIVDRMIEEVTGMKDIITITEIEVDQEKGISQEITITVETEVKAIVDQGQSLEPVQIEIE